MTSFPLNLSLPLTYFLFLLSWFPGQGQDQDNSPKDPVLRNICDSFWTWKLREFPEVATYQGFHMHDDELESYSYGRMTQRMEFCRDLLLRMDTVNKTGLCQTDRLTYDTLLDQLQSYVSGYEWRDYGALNPLNFMEGMHKSFGWVFHAKFDTLADYDKYTQRLNSVPRQIEDVVQLLERAVSLRRTNHAVSMRGVVEGLSELVEMPPEQTPFYIPYRYNLELVDEPEQTKTAIRHQGVNLIQFTVQQSFRRLRDYLQTRYMGFTRAAIGVGSLDNGLAYYENVLRWHLSVNVTAEQVHNTGLAEMSRIQLEMETLMQWLNFDGDMKSFFKHLRESPEFFDHDEDSLLDKYKDIVYNRIEPRLPQLFANLSLIPNVSVKAMTEDGLDAYYVKGSIVINTFQPHTKPDFAALAHCLHEAMPGHHLQISYAKNQPLHNFQKYMWFNKQYAAPFHLPIYSAYVEGWALYAEFLGEQLGLFNNPYELFGRYTLEIFRACRLVVDTGIHAMGWGREQAIEFLTNSTFMTRTQIEKEVDRYITWPGQACSYKIGELKIKELRNRAITKLGWRYSPHEFHRSILEIGPVPLSLLEKHVDEWIDRNIPSIAQSKHMDNFNFAVVIFTVFYRTLLFQFNLL